MYDNNGCVYAATQNINTDHLTLFLILYFCLRLVRPDFPFFFTMLLLLAGNEAVEQAKPAVSKGVSGTHSSSLLLCSVTAMDKERLWPGFEAFPLPHYSLPRTTR